MLVYDHLPIDYLYLEVMDGFIFYIHTQAQNPGHKMFFRSAAAWTIMTYDIMYSTNSYNPFPQ